MYLRPDEVARVLEGSGFERDYVDDKTYGYRRGVHYVYVNREARLGRTALVIHPALKDYSLRFAQPTSEMRTSQHYTEFPRDPSGGGDLYYGIPHGFSSRQLLASYLENVFK
ncbi:hypothetical protein CYR55_11000 [Chimaeribacter californicus]|jgi:hypothetical protein|uniref:DUF2002 domain-containing protein n=1 Tax=Chimaeribacter californicus TaxID=2060067 RepID=A0A2N5E5X7_9GAMM|nr:DUF2002 family protein [Chimaeribacter californicus]PLR36730.1 hypothetical protein CYR55_11000 [Chimaeribacter californicus]